MVLLRIPLNFGAIHLFSEQKLYPVYNILGISWRSQKREETFYVILLPVKNP